MITFGKITNAQYELLIALFKKGMSNERISDLTGISFRRICSERERWKTCCKINRLYVKPRWNKIHPSSSSKVFSY